MFSYNLINAKANIRGNTNFPSINGQVYFKQTKDGTLITAKIYNLPISQNTCIGKFFGFHIHEGDSCTGNPKDEFANAKMHYNPTKCLHPYHIGDLPPLLENNGYAYMSVLVNKIKIQDIIGKAIIIHDMPDDFTTQPSGNSGTKIACGMIK